MSEDLHRSAGIVPCDCKAPMTTEADGGKPTARPWHWRRGEGTNAICDPDNRIIGYGVGRDADAAHIVHCVNLHEELVEALRTIAPHLMLSHEPVISDCLARSHGDELRRAADHADAHEAAVRKVRAVLAKVKA